MTNLKFKKRLCLLTLFVFVLVATLGAWIGINAPIVSTEIADAATSDYYASLNENLTGTAFRAELASLITSTHKYNPTYDGLRNIFDESDADPNKSGNILWFYTGTSVSFNGSFNTGTNREHVWPKNAGRAFPETTDAGSDAHHLRPANSSLNSTRSNNNFGEVATTSGNIVKENGSSTYANPAYQANSVFYPGVGYRGATARILMYVQTRWGDKYSLTFVLGQGNNKTIGDIEDLMKWHLEEPPTAEEKARNEAVYAVQGNRNPFIDHPEYAEMIYCHDGKNYNDELQACVEKYGSYLDGNSGSSDVTPTSLSISPSATSLSAGATARLTVTANPAGASSAVTWTSSNSNVASVNNGVVTGISAGTATITATSTKDSSVKATTTINVKAISAVSVTGTPTKTKYISGETFNPAGLTVTATYTDGSTQIVANSDCQWIDGTKRTSTLAEGSTTVIMKYGNFEKTISGITVEKSTTQKLTITRSSFTGGSGYAWTNWSAASVSGKGFMYNGNNTAIQMNNSKTAYYLFNSTALPGGIVSITVKSSADKQWEVRTSSTPFTEGSKTTTAGTARGTLTSSTAGGTLTINTTDTYFALNYNDSGAVYIDEIVIVYNAGDAGQSHTHTPGQWIVDSESTCKVAGSRHTECTGCGEVVDVEELPLENHKYGNWTPGTNNTETRTCSVCGDVESREAQGGGNTGNEVDQQKVDAFTSAVDAVENANTLTEKWNSIKSALTLYNQLNSAEKTAVAEDYATLEVEIVEYNNGAAVVNAESKKATEDAIMLFAGAFSILAFAAYFLLRR